MLSRCCAALVLVFPLLGALGPAFADGRASQFVAGAASQSERFGPLEGSLLFGLAVAAVVAVAVLLVWSAIGHRKLSERLGRIEAALSSAERPHA